MSFGGDPVAEGGEGADDALMEQVRMSREHAMLGNYETALVYYDGVVAAVGHNVRNAVDGFTREKWAETKEKLQGEARLVKEIVKELSVLRRPPGSGRDTIGEGAGGVVERREEEEKKKERKRAWPAPRAAKAEAVPSRRVRRGGKEPSGERGRRGGGGGGRDMLGRARGGGGVAVKGKGGVRGERAEVGDGEEDEDGRVKKPPFSEVNPNAVDAELIRMVEQDILDTNPSVKFDDIAGLEEAKGLIQEAAVLPLLIPDFFKGIRRPWKGVLMFGPPGTGKTMLAKAVASECSSTFFNVTSTTLTSKWRGESERVMRLLFTMARYHAPSVIFFDEIDALASSRGKDGEHEASRRVKTELLVQMDGVSAVAADATALAQDSTSTPTSDATPPRVLVLAATNLPWELDEAFRRRLEKRVYIPLPTHIERQALFKIATQGVPLAPDVDLDALATAADGYSGADITVVCRDAAMQSMRKLMADARRRGLALDELKELLAEQRDSVVASPITMQDFTEALRKVSTSVGSSDVERFKTWMKEFGSV